MSFSKSRIIDVHIDMNHIRFSLENGCELAVPISWYPKLERASINKLKTFRLTDCGTGIMWDDIDELIKLEDVVNGKHYTPPKGNRPAFDL